MELISAQNTRRFARMMLESRPAARFPRGLVKNFGMCKRMEVVIMSNKQNQQQNSRQQNQQQNNQQNQQQNNQQQNQQNKQCPSNQQQNQQNKQNQSKFF